MPVWMLAVLRAVASWRRITRKLRNRSCILTDPTICKPQTNMCRRDGVGDERLRGGSRALMQRTGQSTDVDFTTWRIARLFGLKPNWASRGLSVLLHAYQCGAVILCFNKATGFGGEVYGAGLLTLHH